MKQFSALCLGLWFAAVVVSPLAAAAQSGKTNTRPEARIIQPATPDPWYAADQRLSFDGRSSVDADGDRLSYQWSLSDSQQQQLPLTASKSPVLTVQLSQSGSYVLSLVVHDGKTASVPVTVRFRIAAAATLTADAGPAQQVKVGQLVELSSQHSVSQSLLTSQQWQFLQRPAASQAQLLQTTTASTAFVPDVPGEYKVGLRLANAEQQTASTVVSIQAQSASQNSVPVAVITAASRLTHPDRAILLSAAQSKDADGTQSLRYRWRVLQQPVASQVQFSDVVGSTTNFQANKPGNYRVELQVTDQAQAAATAVIELKLQSGALPPVARFDAPATGRPGDKLMLDASASTSQTQPLSYQWQLLARPEHSQAELQQADQVQAWFTPDVVGQYVLALQVSDGQTTVRSSGWLIDVPARPVARIAAASSALTGEEVQLDGSASRGADGTALSYRWTLLAAPVAALPLTGADQALVSFTPPIAGPYLFGLVVLQQGLTSIERQHLVMVTTDLPPVIKLAGPVLLHGRVGELFQPDASQSSDPELTALTFHWTLSKPTQSQAQLQHAGSASPSLVADVAGVYQLLLTLTDATGQSSTALVEVRVTEPQPIISGEISGRLLDPDGEVLLQSPQLSINQQSVAVDAAGFFRHRLSLEAQQQIRLQITGEGLPGLSYQTEAITEDNFRLELPVQQLPVAVPLLMTVMQGCARYDGPARLELEFNLSGIQSQTQFTGHFSQKVTVDLRQFEPVSLLLPAGASYQVNVTTPGVLLDHSFGSGTFAPSQHYQHEYLTFGDLMNSFTVCK